MVETDVREENDAGANHVRGVEATAEPSLHDGDVHATTRELGERRGGDRLELRRAEPFGGRPHACERGVEVGLLAVDGDPLRP